MELKDKIVVITGSSSGIGQAIARKFAQKGARVVVNSNTNTAGGEEVANSICKDGGDAIYIQADVTDPKQVKDLFLKTVAKYGSVDILINNAGKATGAPFIESTKEHWLEMLEVNLVSSVLCSIEAVKIMKPKGSGRIINTASVRGIDHTGRPGIMAYSAAKAAVINFTKTLAKELAPDILVNAVAPGFVKTPPIDNTQEDLRQQWLANIPLGRFITMEEIADSYIFLASSDILTGTVLVADAGFTLKEA